MTGYVKRDEIRAEVAKVLANANPAYATYDKTGKGPFKEI